MLACLQSSTNNDQHHKSLFRTGRGCVGWVHHPNKCSVGDEITALPTQLRGNHYWLRSFQDVREKSILWGKVYPMKLLNHGADKFYDTIYDGAALPYVLGVRQRLHRLMATLHPGDIA